MKVHIAYQVGGHLSKNPEYLRCCPRGHRDQVCCYGDWTCLLASAAYAFVCTGTLHTP